MSHDRALQNILPDDLIEKGASVRTLFLSIPLLLLTFACGKETTVTTDTTATAAANDAPAAAAPVAASAPSSATESSLTSFSAGALLVTSPQEYGGGWPAWGIIDEYPEHGWATPNEVVTPQTFVIALPERTLLQRLEFDTGNVDGDGRGAKDVVVEVSDTSAETGFTLIAAVALADKADRQSFPVASETPGRWVRLTVRNNHGAADYIELLDFRGYGKQLTQTPFANASGTYETDYGRFHLKHEGTSVTGCYEYDGGLLTGGLEGRVMKFTWRENGGPDDQGPALMVFSADGKSMRGIWGTKGSDRMTGTWDGTKVSSEVGSCPHWSSEGGVEKRMKDELAEFGRTRVYGINFDTDSDVIREESKPTLDKIVAVMNAEPTWSLSVEGHTDSSGGDAYNQELSQKRAESVKRYLVNAGIADKRLKAAGFGVSKPVADNGTAGGRAQNRRVELAKM
jgi:outer membrane protein OmpA-like peptidoglycan-associated protein